MERIILLLLFSGWRRMEAAETCMHCIGEDYTGTVSITVNGYTCQRWDSQTPHQHVFDPLLLPGINMEENYCRNPDGELGPWCYTTSPSTRWGFCSIPRCVTEPPAIVPEHTCITGDGHLYRGTISVTKSGITCQSWVSQTPHTHDRTPENYNCRGLEENNFCRNPDKMDAPWCYTTLPGRRWEYCDIPICVHPPIHESKQQIVRLEVKSDQNVDDPSVQESILQWVKQKLKDHGLEDTTVAWRVQPDGNVFSPQPQEGNLNQTRCSDS